MSEVNKKEIRIPVNSGYGKILGSFVLSKRDGIYALYGEWRGGKKKIATVLFLRSKGWTIEKAKAWVTGHKSALKENWVGSMLFMKVDEDKIIFTNLISEETMDKKRIDLIVDKEKKISVRGNEISEIVLYHNKPTAEDVEAASRWIKTHYNAIASTILKKEVTK